MCIHVWTCLLCYRCCLIMNIVSSIILTLLKVWMFRLFSTRCRSFLYTSDEEQQHGPHLVLSPIVRLNAATVLCSVLTCTNVYRSSRYLTSVALCVCQVPHHKVGSTDSACRRGCKSKNVNSHCYNNNNGDWTWLHQYAVYSWIYIKWRRNHGMCQLIGS